MMKCGIAALSLFSKIIMIEYLTSIFVIPCSIFVIRFFKVSFSIKLAVFLANGGAYMKLQESNVIFVKFHTQIQSKGDNNQVKSTANVLTPET
jgi:hypothetical protein